MTVQAGSMTVQADGTPQCLCCKHFRLETLRNTCTAFPEPKEIPSEIMTAQFDHRVEHPGDEGVRYEPGEIPDSLKDDDFFKAEIPDNQRSRSAALNSFFPSLSHRWNEEEHPRDPKGKFAPKGGGGGGTMAERLADYTEGDAKLSAISEIGTRLEKEHIEKSKVYRDKRAAFESYYHSLSASERADPKKIAKAQKLQADYRAARAEVEGIGVRARKEVMGVLKVSDRAKWVQVEGKTVNDITDTQKASAGEAAKFLGNLTAAPSDGSRVRVGFQTLDPSKKQRSHCDLTGVIQCGATISPAVMVHEWGHTIEINMPGARESALAFLKHRVGEEKPQQLNKLFENTGFKDNERGSKDEFDKYFGDKRAYYCGKHLGGKYTELISMGVEALYSDPIGFTRKDPEYAKFVMGILDGKLRAQ